METRMKPGKDIFGWRGKYIDIDLNAGFYEVKEHFADVLLKFLGGRGLAGHYLRNTIRLGWDDPRTPLLFFTGPLVDTPSPTSGRMTIMSKSPLTGTIGDSSVGGTFGTNLKRAGFDGIIIRGCSQFLCGVEINDGGIHIIDASRLEWLETGPCFSALAGKGSVAVIGPAAENGVLFSNIMVDRRHAAGRNGLGLVMASKNLKYITVSGTRKTRVFDPEKLKKANEDVFRLTAASPFISGKFGISRFGTGALYDLMDSRGMTPTDNFKKSKFSSAREMNAFAYKKRYGSGRTGCSGCHIRCKHIDRMGNSLPEFETMSHFSALLLNRDIGIVAEANRICNETGMDTISAAATLSCYAEISGKTLSGRNIISLLTDIAKGQGEGIELGRGSARYAESKGRSETAMTVKGQELSAYDPRGAYGMALAFAVSTRGACHLRAYPISHEILRKPVATDRFSFAGKARIIKIAEDLNAAADSLTACKFVFMAASLEEYAGVFSAVTGVETSARDLFEIGERICYNERIMNFANGFDAADDILPDRFFRKDADDSGQTARPIDKDAFLKTLENYRRVRGLTGSGRPDPETAKKLDLTLIPDNTKHG